MTEGGKGDSYRLEVRKIRSSVDLLTLQSPDSFTFNVVPPMQPPLDLPFRLCEITSIRHIRVIIFDDGVKYGGFASLRPNFFVQHPGSSEIS